MSKLYMMAGAVAKGTVPNAEQVSAYVILSEGPKSRLFKLSGLMTAPRIDELATATTLDLKRFQEELKKDLEGLGPLHPADATWACETVRLHLRADLGV